MTVSEAALVAGILPAPSSWDPAISPDQAKDRWQRVLDYMLEDGYITQDQYDSATYPQTVASENTETYAATTATSSRWCAPSSSRTPSSPISRSTPVV